MRRRQFASLLGGTALPMSPDSLDSSGRSGSAMTLQRPSLSSSRGTAVEPIQM